MTIGLTLACVLVISNFKGGQIFSFDWSREEKLVISHGESTSDVVMIKNAKQR